MKRMKMIQTFGLVKQYKTKTAVDQVSMTVESGDIYGLIGKNGAGKTSLMKLILGLTQPTNGSIRLFESEDLNAGRKNIGSLIEAPGLYKNCSAYENLLRFSKLYGADISDINGILKKVGLSNTGNKKAGDFSLGMRQRLGIAIALLNHPKLLILDEPINGLDPAGIKEIRDIIISLHESGVTMVISSHLLDELAKVVTKYGIIADGQLVEEISSEELNAKCRNSVILKTNDNHSAIRCLNDYDSTIKAGLEEESIVLFSHFDKTAEINKYLVDKGFAVSRIEDAVGGFENFFIERLGK